MKIKANLFSYLIIFAWALSFPLKGQAQEMPGDQTLHELTGEEAEEKFANLMSAISRRDEILFCENQQLGFSILSNRFFHCGLAHLPNGSKKYSCIFFKKSGKIIPSELPVELESLCAKESVQPQHTISGFGHVPGKKDGEDKEPGVDFGDGPKIKIDVGGLSPDQIEDLIKILGEDNWLSLLKERMQLEVQ